LKSNLKGVIKSFSNNKTIMVRVVFISSDGTEKAVEAEEGTTILQVAHGNDIELEGACGGCLACATCHVIVDKRYYDMLPPPTETENDLLDFAFGAEPTSRLGCQIIITKDLEGIRVKLPATGR
jgi:ferredoxin